MKPVWLGVLALSSLWAASFPSAEEIVKKSVAKTQADWKAAPQYDFTERDGANGKSGQKTYRVMMIEGSTYNKLLSQNGKPLSGAAAKEEERKLQQEIAKRRSETPEQRRRRIAQYQRERHQDHALVQSMVDAFDFRLMGEDTVNGRRCFVLQSTPKPSYRPTSRETKVLTGMRGKLWVDATEYQWVKVEAEVFRPVTFGLFIAHVQPGTQFALEQQPVQQDIWLPSHFSMKVKATVLLWSRNSTADEVYSDYRPAKGHENSSGN